MSRKWKWITPFKKQCFVVVGASVNMSQIGMVMGYASSLLPQLRAAGVADHEAASWVAAMPGVALLIGNLAVPSLMVRFGRRVANLTSIAVVILGWASMVAAPDLAAILVGRLLQGVSAGMSSCLVPIMIGEYTSPRNRGPFSILMSLMMAAGTFTVHTVGAYVSWKMTAFIITVISVVDFVIVYLSPETPSWLADRGRYAECEDSFRWLRGTTEDDELAKMIEARQIKLDKQKITLSVVKKKEFYKPIIIMFHLYAMGQWAGINILAPYVADLVQAIAGDVDVPMVMISMDVQRMVSCVLAVVVIRRLRRRTMLFATVGFNAVILLLIAGHVFIKDSSLSHPAVGIVLLHLLMMTVATGSLPLPFTIAGEIFPLRYKGYFGGVSSVFCSINAFISVKTFPFLEREVGVDGACLLYAGIVTYCLLVVWFLLPETKDRTLQQIENEFKGTVTKDEMNAAQPLNTLDLKNGA